MLPKHVIDLLEGFVRTFDSDHPAVIEFRKARNQVVQAEIGKGFSLGCSAVIPIGQKLTSYLDNKAKFVWAKLQDVITSTRVAPYAELSADLKSLIALHFNPTRNAAERYLEDMRQEFNATTGYTVEAKWAFDNTLSKIYIEIDLFCIKLAAEKESHQQSVSGQIVNIEHFHGIVGPVSKSQVKVSDYSTTDASLHGGRANEKSTTGINVAVKAALITGGFAVIAAIVAFVLPKAFPESPKIKRNGEKTNAISSTLQATVHRSELVGHGGGQNYEVELGPRDFFTEITVHYGLAIDGMSFSTFAGSNCVVGSTNEIRDGTTRIRHESFSLKKGQYIEKIEVRIGNFEDADAILGIAFYTTSGLHVFGKSSFDALASNPGSEICGFFGRSDAILRSIGIIMRERKDDSYNDLH
jgi:hypothetical protein